MKKQKRIALVYDWVDSWGGAERLLLALNDIFPHADWFTSFHNKQTASWSQKFNITTSYMQKLPHLILSRRFLSFPFYPFAFESMDFSKYNLVISVSSSFAKGIITRPETRHISYILSPTRYLWGSSRKLYLNKVQRLILNPYLSYIRKWDFLAAQRADMVLTLSHHIASKIKNHYQRDAFVVYPPFDVDYWINLKKTNMKVKLPFEKYFLVVSRLEPYKMVDLVISASILKKFNLVIVGTGRQENKLKQSSSDRIVFLKNISDAELCSLYMSAEALILPQIEDFGYVALESQVCECPVISYDKGGSLETLLPGKTAFMFDNQSVYGLCNAIENYSNCSYNIKQSIKEYGMIHAKKFDTQFFKHNFLRILNI